MKLVTVAQMRELDRRTIEENGTKGDVLMDRAGQGVADITRRVAEIAGFYGPTIHLFAGRGNNGGDVFSAARHLKEMGLLVEVWLAGAANEVHGDALKHMSKMKSAGIALRELPTKEDWDQEMPFRAFGDVLVDGILGTGTTGPARGPAAGAIQYINAHSQDSLVVAIDIPSGLNADTGAAEGDVVRADVTVTMGLPKKGLVEPCALDYVGSVEVVDIGIPEEYISQLQIEGDREMNYLTDLKPLFQRRPRASHKGNYGHVLLIGGARGYAGSIAMAARAAMRSGAGLVTALVPECIANVVAGASLESMVIGARQTSAGSLSDEIWSEWKSRIDDFDAVLLGPGLTRNPESLTLVRHVIRECAVPLVLDADAISVLGGQPHWIERAKCPVVLTPHPGELAQLFSQEIEEVQKDRCGVAVAAAKFTHATVVLKGAGTVVAQEGKPISINMTGNPGMATGGTGDVLAGMLTSLLGQKLQPYDAARVAVYLHGKAGDMVVCRKSQAGVVAGDLIEEIPYVFRDLTLR
jgi:ADP-dependent NAD(P)H-hydrate dehydratase / NAD(P)H-hydrate epimerase